MKAGDVITMSAGCRHTVIAETELKLIEVQLGEAIDVHDKQKFELEYPVHPGRGLHRLRRAGQEPVRPVWRRSQQGCGHRVQSAERHRSEARDPHPEGDGLHQHYGGQGAGAAGRQFPDLPVYTE